ncbi:alpha-galactosidase [Paenibacillus sp. YPG26]|uniref:alpha-galactosidase n=1 Tax=Paenibacillus sp. YPG26 TaxID=2878915 RepID=UPI00203E779B|nr:alpha-galactosidase [Paenibacillus sp. YPG26]USB34331.1 alpha-galactosidase [Paenibacillus sp. YPG26]
MSIQFDTSRQIFHLQTDNTSYVIQIVRGYAAQLYWGKRIRSISSASSLRYVDRSFSPNIDPDDAAFSLDVLPQEYPAYGHTDFRNPAYQIQLENGTTVTDLKYNTHRIIKGKPPVAGLPATYVEQAEEADTLEIELVDSVINLKVILTYSVFEKLNAITRSVNFTNEGKQDLKILRALSMSVDLPDDQYDVLHLSGAWADERNVERRPLTRGHQLIESRRGASSHQQNPFLALLRQGADENQGEVYGFSLVYSGNFVAGVEVDQYRTSRVSLGINPFDFSWLLNPGESFQTPEAVTVYSDQGLGGMSRTYHKLYRTRLARGEFRDKERPILINNWEATYFNFNADKIESIAKKGRELGIELFVLDDGWFGHRDNDKTSLGDWFVDKSKLPGGLEDLVNRVTSLGMKFGLWFEPEMISEDSELYRSHPDWCLHVPDRSRSTGRNQLVLDFSREEVGDAVIQMVSAILSSAPITYVKWDMNRHMTEVGSPDLPAERQRETAHRYMLGLYRVMEAITSRFPHILFESCSGGGGRFDPGILYYMPQTWTSDNTDAVCRLKIQYGTSIVYPVSSMGSHVSAVPNHQVHRHTSLKMRGDVALSGNFGYELDLTKFTPEEEELVKQQVAFYKETRGLIQFGEYYRLRSPFEGNDTGWMFVSEDQSEAIVMYFKVLAQPNAPLDTLRLRGLNPDYDYKVSGLEQPAGGDALMYAGLNIPRLEGDFQSLVWTLRKV